MEKRAYHILIVDDEPYNLEIVEGFLESEGYVMDKAENGERALYAAFEKPYDLILLDINMPGLDGFAVCERLKRDPDTRGIPIIFLSALNDIDTITRAFSIGAVDYVSKPFNGLELIARVRTHIQIRAYIAEIEAKQHKLAQLATMDSLTKLPNRLRFSAQLKQEIQKMGAKSVRLSLLYINLDHLHKLNDIYGYDATDKILIGFGKLLTDNVLKGHFVARLFGAEFTIIMPGTSEEAAVHMARKLKDAATKLNVVPTSLSCSIGVAGYQPGETPNAFVIRSEKQMLIAKELGGNMVAYPQ